MWQWISDNSGALNVMTSVAMLVVWGFYLQLFAFGYRRQRRCKLLVNMGGQTTLAARCLVSNMSAEPIYVLSILATVTSGKEKWSQGVTDYELSDEDRQAPSAGPMTRQGPLHSAEYRDLGSFADLIEGARHAHGEHEPLERLRQEHRPSEIELTVIAMYGSEDLPVGARRCFRLSGDGGEQRIVPMTVETVQIRSRRARRRLHRHLGSYF